MLHLKEYLPDLKSGLALDVGTRFGEFALTLAEAMPEGSTVIGLDCDPLTIEQARVKNQCESVEFRVGEGENLEFPDNSFELVAISNTLHHIENYKVVLDEMIRVLRPGGVFVINEMYSDCENERQKNHFDQHSLEAKLDMLSGGFQRSTWSRDEILEIIAPLPLKKVQTADLMESHQMDEKLAAKTLKLADKVKEIAEGLPQFEALHCEARRIQNRVSQIGIQRCTQLVYIGTNIKNDKGYT